MHIQIKIIIFAVDKRTRSNHSALDITVKSECMKAIQINIEGVVAPKFAAISHEEKHGFCYMSEKAENFIKSQSLDGCVYQGVEPCESMFCINDGSITRYAIKGQLYDEVNFWESKEGKWEWRTIELRIINIME